MMRNDRSIAVGRSAPTPDWNGLSRKSSSKSMIVITAVTEPINIACVTARSPLSAKNSM